MFIADSFGDRFMHPLLVERLLELGFFEGLSRRACERKGEIIEPWFIGHRYWLSVRCSMVLKILLVMA